MVTISNIIIVTLTTSSIMFLTCLVTPALISVIRVLTLLRPIEALIVTLYPVKQLAQLSPGISIRAPFGSGESHRRQRALLPVIPIRLWPMQMLPGLWPLPKSRLMFLGSPVPNRCMAPELQLKKQLLPLQATSESNPTVRVCVVLLLGVVVLQSGPTAATVMVMQSRSAVPVLPSRPRWALLILPCVRLRRTNSAAKSTTKVKSSIGRMVRDRIPVPRSTCTMAYLPRPHR